MLQTAKQETGIDRPAFMAVLGLLPPYEVEDIKAAYRSKALVAHPDRGGEHADFIRLKEAYDQALEYVTHGGSRRKWIAAKVDEYLQQEEVVAEVLERGGRVEIERVAWLEKSWGEDFAHLAERLRHVYVRNMPDGDKFLAFLAVRRPVYLSGLDLTGSTISSAGLRQLAGFEGMRWLNVSGTGVDYPALQALLKRLPGLELLNARKTRLGWWGQWQLRRKFPALRIVNKVSPAIVPGNETIVFQAQNWHV